MLRLRDVLGALEHHVFEEVGEPRPPGLFVLGPHVVPEVDRDDGREVILGDDDPEAVVEAVVAEGDGRDVGGHAELLGCGRPAP